MFCSKCGVEQPQEHRFCSSCGERLPVTGPPPRRPKVSRWFWSIPVVAEDDPGLALRVSRYVEEFELHTADGTVRVPNHHVRVSIWQDDHVVAALSLPDDEAEELARFLEGSAATQPTMPNAG